MTHWEPGAADGRIYSGGWREPRGGTLAVISPGDGSTVGMVGIADADDVEQAGRAAVAAQRNGRSRRTAPGRASSAGPRTRCGRSAPTSSTS